MKKKQNNNMELEIFKTVVKRNKIKNTGERIDDIVSTLIKNGITLRSANR